MARDCSHRRHYCLAEGRPSRGAAGLARQRRDLRHHARALRRMPVLRGRGPSVHDS